MNPPELHSIKIGTQEIKMFIPEPETFLTSDDSPPGKLYWTRVWPAAIALSHFILANTAYILNKKVLELGAGLGLPSFIAAQYASAVCCSDSNEEAVRIMQQSINYNHADNMDCKVYDWFHLPQKLR